MPHYCRWKDAVQSSYREVAAAANQRSPLPVVPPPEDDELISSWLDRVARFYGLPLRRLLSPYGIDVRTLRLDDIDAGSSAVPLRPVADMLGIEGAHLASRTMAAAYPMATQLLARHQRVFDGQTGGLRYAGCPHCVEYQKIARGFGWLRRDWLLAPRTVCQHHFVPLIEGGLDQLMHPAWATLIRPGGWAQQPASPIASAPQFVSVASAQVASDDGVGELYRRMALTQSAILSGALGTLAPSAGKHRTKGEPIVVSDVVWALTRLDRLSSNRLIHDVFAVRAIEGDSMRARYQQPGPFDFSLQSVAMRHQIMAAAVALLSERKLRRQLLMPTAERGGDQLRLLFSRLTDADQEALIERSRLWPTAWRAHVAHIFAAGLEVEITRPLRPSRDGVRLATSASPSLPGPPSLLIWGNPTRFSSESTH
jgi:TniQ